MNNDKNKIPTTVRGIFEYLKNDDPDITINIVDRSIRQYRCNRYIKRKHNPYIKPYQYELSDKGIDRLNYIEEELVYQKISKEMSKNMSKENILNIEIHGHE